MTSVPRTILHVDMDAFYASVEQRDDPALRGRPVLVGGDGPRGVVAAASYEARRFGCRSAMPTGVARRLCPDAVIVHPRGGRYREVSTSVFAILGTFTPVVQPLSIDEAFLDVTGSRRLYGDGVTIAREIRRRIKGEMALTASVGVAPNKFLAKLASDLDKPDGLTIVDEAWIRDVLPTLEIGRMWGVGPATETKLRAIGIRTFADLAAFSVDGLERRLGRDAARIQALARGRDHRAVTISTRSRSISHERTFAHDVADRGEVRRVIADQADAVARRLRDHGMRARTVTVKIRFGDYRTITRSSALPDGSDRSDEIRAAAATLFDRWAEASFQPVRLIGVGASHLGRDDVQLELFTAESDAKRRELDRLTDEIRGRFGSRAIGRGDSPPTR